MVRLTYQIVGTVFIIFGFSDKKIRYAGAVALSETLKTNTTWNTIILNRLTNDDTQWQNMRTVNEES